MKKLLRLLKKLQSRIKNEIENKKHKYNSINIYFQDESRFGLLTTVGRRLTLKGVKPICPYQHKFEYTYLFGAFSPVTGDACMLELPFCNSDTFQLFINELSLQKPKELKVVFLDNGAFHKAKRLIVPDNIVLIFLPPYSPELNPAEKIWWVIKRELCMMSFKTIDHLAKELARIINTILTKKKIKQITGFKLFLAAFKTIKYV